MDVNHPLPFWKFKKYIGTATCEIKMRIHQKYCKILCEHGAIPYFYVQSQLKGVLTKNWVMDTKSITNLLVKFWLHKKSIASGTNLLFYKDQPFWITILIADNTDYVSRDTHILTDMLK